MTALRRGRETGPEVELCHLRGGFIAETEIRWFFTLEDTEFSAPSNFGRVLSSVGPNGDWRTPEDQANALHSYRRIRGWLRAMPDSDAGVLQAAYEPRNWPRGVWATFGRLSGIAVRLTFSLETWPEDRRAQEVIEMDRAKEIDEVCLAGEERRYLRSLTKQAEARLDQAFRAYLDVRGNGPCVVEEP